MKPTKAKESTALVMGEVKKKYRIIIHQKPTKSNKKEKCRCLTLYDYTGKSDIDKLKAKIENRIIRFR